MRSLTRAAGSTSTSSVASYWPEFGQAGKGEITVRQLLRHEAGLPVVDEPLHPRLLADFVPCGKPRRR